LRILLRYHLVGSQTVTESSRYKLTGVRGCRKNVDVTRKSSRQRDAGTAGFVYVPKSTSNKLAYDIESMFSLGLDRPLEQCTHVSTSSKHIWTGLVGTGGRGNRARTWVYLREGFIFGVGRGNGSKFVFYGQSRCPQLCITAHTSTPVAYYLFLREQYFFSSSFLPHPPVGRTIFVHALPVVALDNISSPHRTISLTISLSLSPSHFSYF
jgi:hypothetical protein